MADRSWRASRALDPDRDYLAVATFFHLRSLGTTALFFRMANRIDTALEGSDGLVGYSLRARPHVKRYWTRSVWTDESALRRFVGRSEHIAAMRSLRPAMRAFRTVRWVALGRDLPPSWPEAIARLNAGD